ncbi:Hsp20/alpha crystallin family protein [Caballeronia sp. dw_19]|uniref:Hsp20/alpha crystallin family protein n=1 Tax=Caballeronia sp. dw_19 TaxID=2719791 RepID=UPI001BD52165|nr:Hsp20/alpha crystallin family protein [Caballeronia sp. dw_19]
MNQAIQPAERPAESSTAVATTRGGQAATTRRLTLTPAVDVLENNHGITVFVDLPGVTVEKLDIKVQDDTLVIKAEAIVPTPPGLRLQHAEITQPHFFRTFALSADFDASRIDAQLRDGVLKLVIPRRDEARPRHIEVTAG